MNHNPDEWDITQTPESNEKTPPPSVTVNAFQIAYMRISRIFDNNVRKTLIYVDQLLERSGSLVKTHGERLQGGLSVPKSNKSSLSSWKSYVLKFRKDLEERRGDGHSQSALSLLLTALTAKKLDKFSDPFELSRLLHDTTKSALQANLRYELSDCANEYEDKFRKLLDDLDGTQFVPFINDPLIFGYTYQYFRDCDRKAAQKSIQTANKEIDRDDLIAFTQIYTPDWVVDFILANTVLPQVGGRIADGSPLSKWQIKNGGRTEIAGNGHDTHTVPLDELTVIDPACGAGNFLVRAFDWLIDLHLRAGHTSEFAVRHVLEEQLFGVDIDPMALSVCAFAIVTRCISLGIETMPPLRELVLACPDDDPMLGSLSRKFPPNHPLAKRHHVVVTNPPYIGRKLISRHLKQLLKTNYPDTHHDLSSAFLLRCLELLKPGGFFAAITQASVMFLPSYARLRELIVKKYGVTSAVDLGPGAFPLQGGEKVNSAILVLNRPLDAIPSVVRIEDRAEFAVFLNLKQSIDKESELMELVGTTGGLPLDDNEEARQSVLVRRINPLNFRKFHGCAFNYHIPTALVEVIEASAPLSKSADFRQGLATTDNDQFVKLAWQVQKDQLNHTWFPYVKGAGEERWYSPVRHVVNWHNDGEEIKNSVMQKYPYLEGKTQWVVKNESFYFKEGLCFSFVNTRGNAVRVLPAGCIFDVGASAIFSPDNQFLLGYLNSSFMVALARSLNPTINYQVGDLKRLPMLISSRKKRSEIASLAARCVAAKRELNLLTDATSWFDPLTTNGGISEHQSFHPKYADLSHKPLAVACTLLAEYYEKLDRDLYQCESAIDDVVLKAISSDQNWNGQTMKDVQTWMDEFGERRNKRSDQNRLHRFIDNYLIIEMLVPEPLSVNAAAIGSVGGVFSNRRFIGQDCDEWMRRQIGCEFRQYVTGPFLDRLGKHFSGHIPECIKTSRLANLDLSL